MPATPACHGGFAKNTLAPPPLAARGAACAGHWVVQVSFHTFSGMYDLAEARRAELVVFQYVASCPFSLNMVPPTATVNGVAARTLTVTGPFATVSFSLSQ